MNRIHPTRRLSVLALLVLMIAAVPASSSPPIEIELSRTVRFDQPDDDLIVEKKDQLRMVRMTGADTKAPIDVYWLGSYSTNKNWEILGRHIDGDAPSMLLDAILEIEGVRAQKLHRPGKGTKTKNKEGDTFYYGVVEATLTPEDLEIPPMGPEVDIDMVRGRLRAAIEKAGDGVSLSYDKPTRMRIYHILLKDAQTTRFDHVVIRTPASGMKVNKSNIRKLLPSLRSI